MKKKPNFKKNDPKVFAFAKIQRSAIEAKINEGKRMYSIGKCRDKGIEKHEIWAIMSVFNLNMSKLLREMKDNKELAVRLANN